MGLFAARGSLILTGCLSLLVSLCLATPTVDIPDLPGYLQGLEFIFYADLRGLSEQIYNHPQIGRNETFAHDLTVGYFQNEAAGRFDVSGSILEILPTAFQLDFSHHPASSSADDRLPTIGFLAEYDALPLIGHACGHNHIWLQGVYAANLVRQTLIDFGIPGRVIVVGTPDEEESCGKHDLWEAGIFKSSPIWLMAHPTVSNAIQPMPGRENIVARIIKDSHFEAVKEAYEILWPIRNLGGKLPGESSTAAIVENVGMFVCNVVQADIALGVVGMDLASVDDTLNGIKTANPGYANTNFSVSIDPAIEDGVAIMFHGNSGHASEDNLGALTMSIDAFHALNTTDPNLQFYLPDNTTSNELDFTVDVRTRWTAEIEAVTTFVLGFIPTENFSLDVIYPTLEVDPYLGPLFVNTIKQPEYGGQSWPILESGPAASDASWIQGAHVRNQDGNHTLVSADKAVLHANYNICPTSDCGTFNHEPGFTALAGQDFAYQATENVARALAQMAVELLNDPDMMAEALQHLDS